jgi:hypothetical protein
MERTFLLEHWSGCECQTRSYHPFWEGEGKNLCRREQNFEKSFVMVMDEDLGGGGSVGAVRDGMVKGGLHILPAPTKTSIDASFFS